MIKNQSFGYLRPPLKENQRYAICQFTKSVDESRAAHDISNPELIVRVYMALETISHVISMLNSSLRYHRNLVQLSHSCLVSNTYLSF